MVLRGAGCTAAGTWRAGAGMGFWSLWGERTIRLRFAASALSLGRSRPRWLGTRVCRRRVGFSGRGVGGVRRLVVLLVFRQWGWGELLGLLRQVWLGCPATRRRPRVFLLNGCRLLCTVSW